jgi:hypothetical protein
MLEWIGHSSSAPVKIRPQAHTTRVRPIRASRHYLPLLLAILLPLLQLGSVLHGLGHLSDSPRNEAADVSKDACALCSAYAATGSAIPGTPPALPAFAALAASGVPVVFFNHISLLSPYLARAPPFRHFT